MYKFEKTPGWFSKALDNNKPFFTSSAIFNKIFLNFLFFSSVLKKYRALSIVKPAENIVDNWRVKNTKTLRGILFFNSSSATDNLSRNGLIKSNEVSLSLSWITVLPLTCNSSKAVL